MKLSETDDNAPRFRKGSKEDQNSDSRKIHVKGVPFEWKNSDMETFFKKFV